MLTSARDVLWAKPAVKGSGIVRFVAAATVGGAAALSWSVWVWIAFSSAP